MKSKSIQWLISSISIFVLGCTIYYFVQYFKGKDPRYNYTVEQSSKKAKQKKQSTILMAQSNEQSKTVEIEKNIIPQKATEKKLTVKKDIKRNTATAKENKQEEFNSEWLVTDNQPESNVIITESATPDEEYVAENLQPTKSETETSQLINMVEEYQNNYFTVQNNTEQTNIPGMTNTLTNANDNSQLIAMADNSSMAQSNTKGPMKATGTGAGEDDFNTGVGTDNTTTCNDNNVMGSLPVGDGNIFLFLLVAITTCFKLYKNKKESINLV